MTVRMLDREAVPHVVSVLAEAFHDYPVMRFVLGNGDDYDLRLARLVTYFVTARVLKGETLLGIGDSPPLLAAALVSLPHGPPGPPAMDALRAETWRALGSDARKRYDVFSRAAAPFVVPASHLHLNMIGVRPSEQGRGLGRALLDAVHGMSASNPESGGVSLTTEVAANVALYERFGYAVVGRAPVADAFTTWTMYRPDAARTPP